MSFESSRAENSCVLSITMVSEQTTVSAWRIIFSPMRARCKAASSIVVDWFCFRAFLICCCSSVAASVYFASKKRRLASCRCAEMLCVQKSHAIAASKKYIFINQCFLHKRIYVNLMIGAKYSIKNMYFCRHN